MIDRLLGMVEELSAELESLVGMVGLRNKRLHQPGEHTAQVTTDLAARTAPHTQTALVTAVLRYLDSALRSPRIQVGAPSGPEVPNDGKYAADGVPP